MQLAGTHDGQFGGLSFKASRAKVFANSYKPGREGNPRLPFSSELRVFNSTRWNTDDLQNTEHGRGSNRAWESRDEVRDQSHFVNIRGLFLTREVGEQRWRTCWGSSAKVSALFCAWLHYICDRNSQVIPLPLMLNSPPSEFNTIRPSVEAASPASQPCSTAFLSKGPCFRA